ncbi:MAG: MerR family transcriptional regulator [Actinobacteria bacterium]|nr:MerR family transcriptional regulator [Actinomycetota bacterium]
MTDNKKTFLTIGELVKKFKKYYPELTSSKLRFLESRGLIVPKRSQNRYRVYFKNDVRKINLILKMQKEYFMPLEVIKEKIDVIDFSKIEKHDEGKSALRELQTKLEESERSLSGKKMTLESVQAKLKLSKEYTNELAAEGLINLKDEDGKIFVDSNDTDILRVISELSSYGIHIKHLKLFENAAVRQSSFLQQIVYPLFVTKGRESHKKAAKILYKLESLFIELNESLFKRENKKFLENHK